MACDRSCRPNSSRGRCSCRSSWPCRAAESAAFPCPEGLAADPSGPAAAVRATARALPARCRRSHEAPGPARRLCRLGGCRAGTGRKSSLTVVAFSLVALSLRPRGERRSYLPATARMLLHLLPIWLHASEFPPRAFDVSDVMAPWARRMCCTGGARARSRCASASPDDTLGRRLLLPQQPEGNPLARVHPG